MNPDILKGFDNFAVARAITETLPARDPASKSGFKTQLPRPKNHAAARGT